MVPRTSMTALKPTPLKSSTLFTPIKVGTITVQHRICLAPMTRTRYSDYAPGPLPLEYYDQRSKSAGTLVFTDSTFVSPTGGGFPGVPGIWSKEQIVGWGKIFDAIHANGSFVFHQLYALGRQALPQVLASQGLKFIGASDDVYIDDKSKEAALAANNPLHGLTIPEIKQFVNDFVQAAKNSLEAGSDGVDVHVAYGHLLNQFLDPSSNHRDDEYGGSIENRARFALEVVDALISEIGADRVGLRLSPFGEIGGMTGASDPTMLAQYAYLVGCIEKRAQQGNRLAYIHVVEPRVMEEDIGSLPLSCDFIYTIWKGVVIRAGDYGSRPEVAVEHVSKPNTLLSYGRHFISNPDLPDRLYHGYPLAQYDRDTFYTHEKEGYTDYPTYK